VVPHQTFVVGRPCQSSRFKEQVGEEGERQHHDDEERVRNGTELKISIGRDDLVNRKAQANYQDGYVGRGDCCAKYLKDGRPRFAQRVMHNKQVGDRELPASSKGVQRNKLGCSILAGVSIGLENAAGLVDKWCSTPAKSAITSQLLAVLIRARPYNYRTIRPFSDSLGQVTELRVCNRSRCGHLAGMAPSLFPRSSPPKPLCSVDWRKAAPQCGDPSSQASTSTPAN
jgi:hypothetical protein